jgi:hypothetical protein
MSIPHLESLGKQNQLENEILYLNKDWLFELVPMRQPFLNIQWAAKIDQTVRKFMHPIKHYLGPILSENLTMSYFDVWRVLRLLNLRSFNLDSREVDSVIIQLVKIKEREKRYKAANTIDGDTTKINERFDFNEDFE